MGERGIGMERREGEEGGTGMEEWGGAEKRKEEVRGRGRKEGRM